MKGFWGAWVEVILQLFAELYLYTLSIFLYVGYITMKRRFE